MRYLAHLFYLMGIATLHPATILYSPDLTIKIIYIDFQPPMEKLNFG
jgi:hypothetical protein